MTHFGFSYIAPGSRSPPLSLSGSLVLSHSSVSLTVPPGCFQDPGRFRERVKGDQKTLPLPAAVDTGNTFSASLASPLPFCGEALSLLIFRFPASASSAAESGAVAVVVGCGGVGGGVGVLAAGVDMLPPPARLTRLDQSDMKGVFRNWNFDIALSLMFFFAFSSRVRRQKSRLRRAKIARINPSKLSATSFLKDTKRNWEKGGKEKDMIFPPMFMLRDRWTP